LERRRRRRRRREEDKQTSNPTRLTRRVKALALPPAHHPLGAQTTRTGEGRRR